MRVHHHVALCLAACALAPAAAPAADAIRVGPSGVTVTLATNEPVSDDVAAAKVTRSGWEPRSANRLANRRVPTSAELRSFRRRSQMTNRHRVTGDFQGTTDEIVRWAALKWGFDPDLFRAVAKVESDWKMSAVGDSGHSFGLFQLKKDYHCCYPLSARSTAFNADYYGAILRSYFDGRETWLNDMERGRHYRRGDIWGSVGAWYAGRWRTSEALSYIRHVQRTLDARSWR